MTSIFIRTNADNKDRQILEGIVGLRQGRAILSDIYLTDPSSLLLVPNGPFAYSVSCAVRALFKNLPPFEQSRITARAGLCTGDDFRFVRLTWEVEAVGDVGRWIPFAKGGKFACYYSDIHLAVNWSNSGEEIVAGATAGTVPGARPQNISFFFRRGLTWPLRTQSGLGFRVLPAGCVFGHKGPCAFVESDEPKTLLALLALTVSQVFRCFVEIQMAFGSYEVGVIQRTVVPASLDPRLSGLALAAWTAKRRPDAANLTSHAFLRPALTQPGSSLAGGIDRWSSLLTESTAALAAASSEIDDIAHRLYGLEEDDRRAIEMTIGSPESGANDSTGDSGEDEEEDSPSAGASGPALVSELLDYALGCAFGRWDIRYATGKCQPPEQPDPFDRLPVCSPGMLQNTEGLPAKQMDVPADYPLRISWPGILVDNENHSEDIVARVGEAIEVIWKDHAQAIEQEACGILGVKTLRDYFRRPADFFADHLKRYSKSRRQAPIFWPLSTASGSSYTLWVYYHRLTPDILFTALRDFVKPRRQSEELYYDRIQKETSTNPTTENRNKLTGSENLLNSLKTLESEILRVAPLFKPNLNDGVIINQAPLWRMISHPKWQKDCKACWDKLVKGDYDWAHLAMHLWPERVVPKCQNDRSFAIAHGLEEEFWFEDEKDKGKWKKRKVDKERVEELISERSSTAVKAALEDLLSAPVPGGGKRKRKG